MLLARKPGVQHHPFAPWIAPPEQLARTLVGRVDVLRNMLEKIQALEKGATAKHILLIGPRGIGKTHILCFIHHHVCGHIPPRSDLPLIGGNWRSVMFAEELYPSLDTLANFLLFIFQKLADEHPLEEIWQVPDDLSEESDDVVADYCFEKLRDFSLNCEGQFLVLVDNLQKVFEQFPTRDQHRLRAFLNDQTFLTLIGTSPTIFRQVVDYREPFYEFFDTIYLSDLTEDEMLEMLETRFREDGLESDFRQREPDLKRKLPAIIKLTGGNPRLVLFLYDIITHSAFFEVEQALRELIEELSDYFRSRYDVLPPQQRKVLDTLAGLEGPSTPSTIAKAARLTVQKVNSQLKRLSDNYYVEKVKSTHGRSTFYDVSERLFRIWRQTASSSGMRRFKLLAEFLKVYYTPEEMSQLFDSYRTNNQAIHSTRDRDGLLRIVDGLYYLQEAAKGTRLQYEIFKWRVGEFTQCGACDRAKVEVSQFLADSNRTGDAHGIAEAVKSHGDLHIFEGECDAALRDIHELAHMDELDKLVELVTTFHRKFGENTEAFSLLGLAASRSDNDELALSTFQKVIELDSTEPVYWFNHSSASLACKRYEQALSSVQKAIELQPDMADAWELKGRGHAYLEQFDEALRCFQKTAELEPDNAILWRFQAQALLELTKYEEALPFAQKAAELLPAKARSWGVLGETLRHLRRYEEAFESTRKATEIEPGDCLYWLELGRISRLMNNWEQAQQSYRKATEVEPGHGAHWALHAKVLIYLKRHEEALSSATKATEIEPKLAWLWETRGVAATNLENQEEALESFRTALQLDPQNPISRALHITSLECFGKHEEALKCIVEISREESETYIQEVLAGLLHQTLFNYSRQEEKTRHVANCLLKVVLCDRDLQQQEWFRSEIGVFLRSLLDSAPMAFEEALGLVSKTVVDEDILDFLAPYFKAVEYAKTHDPTILDRLFPEVREIVLEIVEKLE